MKNIYLLLFTQLIFSQLQLNSFYPTSGASGTSFGNKVDINNNEVIVSSRFDISLNQLGKVYVFNVNSNSLIQTAVLIESDVANFDGFGSSISNENSKIAVGAPNQGVNNSSRGAVYLYRKVNGIYQFHQKIVSINNMVNDNFGRYVKLFNDRLYISSKNNVYVFDLINEIWTLTQTLSVENETALGRKIEVSNNQLVIYPATINGYSDKIYNFTLLNNQWTYQSTFNYNPGQIFNYKLYNSQLYILDDAASEVKIYDFANDNWTLNSSFQIPGTDQVYDEIVVNDSDIFLGSSWYILQMQRKFLLLHYRKIGGIWTSQPSTYSNEISSQVDDYFGSSMAVQGNQLVIGSKGEKNGSALPYGKVYFGDTSLGLEENDLNAFNFYPNPTKEYLHLNNDFLDEIKSISIFQIDGKLVKNITTNFETIDIRNFSNGAYFLKILFKNNSLLTKKIIKN